MGKHHQAPCLLWWGSTAHDFSRKFRKNRSHPIRKKKRYRCEHGRSKYRCKDCGTCRCEHGRAKNQCKDCGTGRCEHGRQKHQCKDCITQQRRNEMELNSVIQEMELNTEIPEMELNVENQKFNAEIQEMLLLLH